MNPAKRKLQLVTVGKLIVVLAGTIILQKSVLAIDHFLDMNKFNALARQVENAIYQNKPNDAILSLADVFNYVLNGQETSLRHSIVIYQSRIKNLARRISSKFGAQLYQNYWHHIKGKLSTSTALPFQMWHATFSNTATIITNAQIETFFVEAINALTKHPQIDPGMLIDAFVLQRGYCNLFNYPVAAGNKIDATYNFARFAFLVSKHEELHLLTFPKQMTESMQQLSLICDCLKQTILPLKERVQKARRQAILSALLENRLIAPVSSLEAYNSNKALEQRRDFCSLIERDTNEMKRRFVSKNTIEIFVGDCVDELVEQLHKGLAKPEWAIYKEALISRWLMRIGELRLLGKAFELEKYLPAIVVDVPAVEAKLAYANGTGLCSIFDDKDLKRVVTLYKLIFENLKLVSIPFYNTDPMILTDFWHLYAFCVARLHGNRVSFKATGLSY